MFLRIISPTSGSFQLIPQTSNNSTLVDLYMNGKLRNTNRQDRSVSVRVRLGLAKSHSQFCYRS